MRLRKISRARLAAVALLVLSSGRNFVWATLSPLTTPACRGNHSHSINFHYIYRICKKPLRIVVSVPIRLSLSTHIYIHLPSNGMHTKDGAWRGRPLRHHARDGYSPSMMAMWQRDCRRSLSGSRERSWGSTKDEDSTPAVTPYRWYLM